jgi:Uma2 family endonuclease
VRASGTTILIPDLLVARAASGSSDAGRSTPITYAQPLPLIVEVQAPPRDGYDVAARVRIYQQRGDREIWRIDPTDRTLTTWVQQPYGAYTETIYQFGTGWPMVNIGIPTKRATHYHA